METTCTTQRKSKKKSNKREEKARSPAHTYTAG